MRRGPATRSAPFLAILGACLLTFAVSPHRARCAASTLFWLVPSEGDLEDWSRAAEETWPATALTVRVWDGLWPPSGSEIAEAHAFLDLTDGRATLCVRGTGDVDTSLPLETGDSDSHEGRNSILLILRGLASPLGIGDGGWMPPPPPLPEVEEPLPIVESPVAPLPSKPSPLSISIAIGASGRPGLDTPSLAPSVSPAIRLAATRSTSLHLAADLSADLGGRVDLGSVPAQLDSLLIAGGLEIQPTVRRTTLVLRVAGGVHVHRAHLPDHDEAQALAQPRPALRFVGGVRWPLVDGVRLGFQAAWTADLIAAGIPIRLGLVQGDSQATADVAGWSLAGQACVEFRDPGIQRAP